MGVGISGCLPGDVLLKNSIFKGLDLALLFYIMVWAGVFSVKVD